MAIKIWCLVVIPICLATSNNELKARAGDDITLPCPAFRNQTIGLVEWSRPDMLPDYVFLYRDGHVVQTYQLPSYEGRVRLADGPLTDGNLIVRNVTRSDAGTYQCVIVPSEENRRRKRSDGEQIKMVVLNVIDEEADLGQGPSGSRIHPGLVVFLVGGVVVAGLGLITLRFKRDNSGVKHDEEEVEPSCSTSDSDSDNGQFL